MVQQLKKLQFVNAFLIVFNAQQPRLDQSLRAMLQIFTLIFGGVTFYKNVILGFTRWEHSQKADRQRQRTGLNFEPLITIYQ